MQECRAPATRSESGRAQDQASPAPGKWSLRFEVGTARKRRGGWSSGVGLGLAEESSPQQLECRWCYESVGLPWSAQGVGG